MDNKAKAKTQIFLGFILMSLVFLSLLSIPFILGQNESDSSSDESAVETELTEKTQVNLAVSWLSSQVKSAWPSNPEENALALLALSFDSYLAEKGKKALLAKAQSDGKCWGISGCEIKATALALLALNKLGEKTDVKKIENWLLGKKKTFSASGLAWYLQIDSDKGTACTVGYESGSNESEYKILLHEKPKQTIEIVEGSSGGCLSLSDNNYWLVIKDSDECSKKTYNVNCEEDAKVSLPFKKGSIFFIPGETYSTPPPVGVKIKVECLIDSNGECDYEGTAWAAYVLNKQGKSIGYMLPYLLSQADDEKNKKYLPDAFIYLINPSSGDYAQKLVNSEYYYKAGYWRTVPYGKYYATALAVLALEQPSSEVKTYLLEHQDANGYWDDGNRIKDTSLMLYSLWYGQGTTPVIPEENQCEEEESECKDACAENEKEIKYYNADCEKEFGSGYKCCQVKKTNPECTSMEDCLKYECEDNWIENCKCELKEKSCDDGCDNDMNGLTDSEDTDCQVSECERNNNACCHECEYDYGHISQYDSSCSTGICCESCSISNPEDCTNKVDDDGDKLIDCKDPDCKNNKACKSKLWLWIVLLLLIGGGAAAYFFYFRKKGFDFSEILSKFKKKKEKPGYKFTPALARTSRPFAQPARPGPLIRPAGTLIRPGPPTLSSLKQAGKEKTDTEKQLDETLKKLKKMSE